MRNFSAHGKSAIETILKCMQTADEAFRSLSNEENKACLDFHGEGVSLNHCTRWGLTAAEEIRAAVIEAQVVFEPGDKVFVKSEQKLATVLSVYGDGVDGSFGVMRLDLCGNTDVDDIELYDPVKHAQFDSTFTPIDARWKLEYGITKDIPVRVHDVAEQALDIEVLIKASTEHGLNSEPDHEAGDLQDYLREAWSLISIAQRKSFLKNPAVMTFIETAVGLPLKVTESRLKDYGIENLLDIAQEHGNDEGANVEIRDLQDMLRACWAVMDNQQRVQYFEIESVQDTYENATLHPLAEFREHQRG